MGIIKRQSDPTLEQWDDSHHKIQTKWESVASFTVTTLHGSTGEKEDSISSDIPISYVIKDQLPNYPIRTITLTPCSAEVVTSTTGPAQMNYV